MKHRLCIPLLLFVLYINLVACAKEDPVIPPTTEELIPPTTPDDGSADNENQTDSISRLRITIGEQTMTATLYNNSIAKAFLEMLPLTLNMSDFNNNEKVYSLSSSLPTSASNPRTIQTGDIMLYGSRSIVLFYETFSTSHSYTKIGRIDNPYGLKAVLGVGDITIKFELK